MNTSFLLHIGLAYLSLILLLTRGVLSAKRIDWRQYKLLKIAPHIVDTLLLLSGLGIFFYYGFTFETWLWQKTMFIAFYVWFTFRAFRKNQLFSIKHFILAVVSFMLTMFVAATHI